MKIKIKKKLLAVFFLCLPFSLLAETIILKSGKKIEGKIVERTENKIKVDVSGIPITYYFDEIESIDGEKSLDVSTEKDIAPGRPADHYLTQGKHYAFKTDYKQAMKYFKKALELEPNSAEILIRVGITYGLLDQHKKSIDYLEKALEIDPEGSFSYFAYTGIGMAYGNLGQHQKAISYYQRAIKIYPDNPRCYHGLGFAYGRSGQHQKAIDYFQKAIQMNPNMADAYSSIGTAYEALGQYQEAKENYLKAKELFQIQGDSKSVKEIEEYLNELQK